MEKRLFVALAVIMAFSLPFLAMGCGGGDVEPVTTDATAAPDEVGVDMPEPDAGMPDSAATAEPDQTPSGDAPMEDAEGMSAEPPAGESAAEAAVEAVVEGTEAEGEALTAENLIGTKWNAGGMSFTFEKDGVLKVNDELPGTWSIEGTTLTVGAMGQEYAATIEGGRIVYDGTPLERAN